MILARPCNKRIFLSCVLLIFVTFSCLNKETVNDNDDKLSISWNVSGPSHSFWPEDEECSQHVTRFAVQHSLKIRALVSYGGSGNSWLRFLIEAASGVFTGSIFEDKSILSKGHLGEAVDYRDGSTLVQKTHHAGDVELEERLEHMDRFVRRNNFQLLLLEIRVPQGDLNLRSNTTSKGVSNTTVRSIST